MQIHFRYFLASCCLFATTLSVSAQMAPNGPPAVGTITIVPQAVNETTEVNGRVQSIGRVDLVARVSAFLEQQAFTEGSEVKKGDLLFRLERPPFEADVEAKEAAVAQAQATLDNANIALSRAQQLRQTGSGTQSTLDDAQATQRTAAAQLRSAQAALRSSEISLSYTDIRSPIDGRIGRTSVTVGNVVTASSGTLATVVSQDPMYVTFPISMTKLIELRARFEKEGGIESAMRLRLRLPDGRMYDQTGALDFFDTSISQDTDSITLRGRISNPVGSDGHRELFNSELVRVVLETNKPRQTLAVPRAAVLTDQQGDYVYIVDGKGLAQIARITLGQSSPATASVTDGLKEGDHVIVDGVQRVRPGSPVDAQPETTSPAAPNQAANRS